jgi:hypothetical protein
LTFSASCPILDYLYTRRFKCPAEEKENCEKSPRTNARKNCGKTDTKTNNGIGSGCWGGGLLFVK